jgi:AcrR family transcriptional regulator
MHSGEAAHGAAQGAEHEGEDRRVAETRAEILRHSHELFVHYGFAKTTVGDIAKRTCMSPGNLYRYFRNKQDIGRTVVVQYFRDGEAEMTVARDAAATPEARIRAIVHAGIGHIVREMDENPRLVELADFICSDPEGHVSLMEHINWIVAAIAREIAEGQAEGAFGPGDPDALAQSMKFAVNYFWVPMSLAWVEDRSTVPASVDRILDLIFAGLRAR